MHLLLNVQNLLKSITLHYLVDVIYSTVFAMISVLLLLQYVFAVGEIFELKAELNSDKKDRKKEAVKKVIASMTVGKDVR